MLLGSSTLCSDYCDRNICHDVDRQLIGPLLSRPARPARPRYPCTNIRNGYDVVAVILVLGVAIVRASLSPPMSD